MLFKKYHKKSLKGYDKYMDKKYKNRPDKDNILGVGLTDSEFRHFAINIILGEDWWAPNCTLCQANIIFGEDSWDTSCKLCQEQVNEEALEEILLRLGAKHARERRR